MIVSDSLNSNVLVLSSSVGSNQSFDYFFPKPSSIVKGFLKKEGFCNSPGRTTSSLEACLRLLSHWGGIIHLPWTRFFTEVYLSCQKFCPRLFLSIFSILVESMGFFYPLENGFLKNFLENVGN